MGVPLHYTMREPVQADVACYQGKNLPQCHSNTCQALLVFSVWNDLVSIYVIEQGGDNRDRSVFLDVKHGTEMKDYDAIAKAEKLKPLEKELRKLEDLSESIVNDFAYMRSREEEMRDTNGGYIIYTVLYILSISHHVILHGNKVSVVVGRIPQGDKHGKMSFTMLENFQDCLE